MSNIPNIMPKNEREKELADFWKQQGLMHAEPSKETLKILNNFEVIFTELKGEIKHLGEKIEAMSGQSEDIERLEQDNISIKKDIISNHKLYEEWRKGIYKTVTVAYVIIAGLAGFFINDYFTSRDSNIKQGEQINTLQRDVTSVRKQLNAIDEEFYVDDTE